MTPNLNARTSQDLFRRAVAHTAGSRRYGARPTQQALPTGPKGPERTVGSKPRRILIRQATPRKFPARWPVEDDTAFILGCLGIVYPQGQKTAAVIKMRIAISCTDAVGMSAQAAQFPARSKPK